MNIIKMGLSKKSVSELIVYATSIHTNMTAQAAVFSTPPVTMADFLVQINNLMKAEQATLGGGKPQTTTRNARRAELRTTLRQLANYAENVSLDDVEIIESAGFEVRSRNTAQRDILDTVRDVNMAQISEGTLRLRWQKVAGARTYRVEYTDNPARADSWINAYYNSASYAEISNLEKGRQYFFRVQALGTRNVRSDWSEIASRYII